MSVSHPRCGVVFVWFAVLLIVLLSFSGLVIDVGLLMASHRHAQNAADAAALAGAHDLYWLGGAANAIVTAKDYASTHNGIANPDDVVVNIPPSSSSAYAGQAHYVEAIVSQPVNTYFIHLLGVAPTNTVTARATAGYEEHSAGEGVMVLDPHAYPGLTVQGGGVLLVNGRIIVNSEGEGVGLDENGEETLVDMSDPPDGDINDTPQPAVAVTDADNIRAVWLHVVGGVDVVENYLPYDPEETQSPLHTGQLPMPDPMENKVTPTTATGVDPTNRGIIAVTNQGITGQSEPYIIDNRDPEVNPKVQGSDGQNFIADGTEVISDGGNLHHFPAAGEIVVYPGLYDEISISDGTVLFVPGIYVLTPQKQNTYSLSIQGGEVTALGVMFYNTANNYSPESGMPDATDLGKEPPRKQDATEQELLDFGDYAGGFNITSGMHLSPIDTQPDTGYNYGAGIYDCASPLASPNEFQGMLFYQRRWNTAPILIRGNETEGGSSMGGTLYAKWARFDLAGQGIYDAQFIAGSMAIDGRANIRILATGTQWGFATKVYLVE